MKKRCLIKRAATFLLALCLLGTTMFGVFPVSVSAEAAETESYTEVLPKETKPEEIKSEGTEPEKTDPKETEPEKTDPKEIDPKETDPKETDPKETEPEETEPEEIEPEEIEPEETEPEQAKATEYTIIYEVNGGTMPESYGVVYSAENVVTLPVPSKDGYEFKGWYEAADFSGEAVTSTKDMEGNKTFYAKWEVIEVKETEPEETEPEEANSEENGLVAAMYGRLTRNSAVPTDIYFLNSNGWESVGAYIYGEKGDLLGSWGNTTATSAGGNWVKVTAPDAPPYSIVFYNKADDTQRAELYLGDATNVYVTVNAVAYGSTSAAEASVAPAPEPDPETTVYFYNSNDWATVGAHAWNDDGDLTGGWGTTTAAADSGKWVKVTVPAEAPFNIIFFNTEDGDNQCTTVTVTAESVYATLNNGIYTSKEAAEAAMAPAPEPDPETTVYFYNSNDWATVGAHAWNDGGDLTGGWGTTTAAADSGKWVKVTVPAEAPFNIIFFNTEDGDNQRTTVTVTAESVCTTSGKP